MINVGIIGGSGYTAGELIRILMYHPNVNIDFVYSTTNAGKPLSVAHHDLLGDIEMDFTDAINPDVNVLFLCLGHGKSISFLQENKFAGHTKIIDLGNDFRLTKDSNFDGKQFVYGLPELNKTAIKKANYIHKNLYNLEKVTYANNKKYSLRILVYIFSSYSFY